MAINKTTQAGASSKSHEPTQPYTKSEVRKAFASYQDDAAPPLSKGDVAKLKPKVQANLKE